jgi:hypothetical protein
MAVIADELALLGYEATKEFRQSEILGITVTSQMGGVVVSVRANKW